MDNDTIIQKKKQPLEFNEPLIKTVHEEDAYMLNSLWTRYTDYFFVFYFPIYQTPPPSELLLELQDPSVWSSLICYSSF